jgi:hypothetical protein
VRRVYFGLMVDEQNGIHQLVQAVQMLRSFGSEAAIDTYSDVLRLRGHGKEPDMLCAIVAGESTAHPSELQEICARTDWALGEEGIALAAVPENDLRDGAELPPLLRRLLRGEEGKGLETVLPGTQFAIECDWAHRAEGQGH